VNHRVSRRIIAAAAALLVVAVATTVIVGLPRIAGALAPGASPAATLSASPTLPAVTASTGPAASAIPVATPRATLPPVPAPAPISMLDRTGIQARLQAALEQDRAALAAPGMVATVLFNDGRSWTGIAGVADLASGRALTANTPFALASVSKTFLAAEILLLVDAGRLALDDRVAPLLPGVLVGGRAIDTRITVRELLDHTSGLRDFLTDAKLDAAVTADPTRRWTATMALAYAGRPLAAPGVGYHYANTNYVLLGLIAERLAGQSLAAEFRSRFFGPLGLTSAFYQGVERSAATLPTAYRYSSVALDAVPRDITDGTAIRPFTALTTATGAAGSIAASAPDVARWARALYGGSVLPAADLEAMIGDAAHTLTLKPAAPYGLGVQVYEVNGRVAYGHGGRLVGAQSVVRYFPSEGVTIVVLTNESRFDPSPVAADLLAVVAPRSIPAVPRQQ
jgi:D-alanyl-D-alanine carboxypeptidase